MNQRSGARSFLCALLLLTMMALPPPARMVSSTVVISQVYGGGGNSGATLKNDFIELFNRGNTTVNLTGWSVQYASSAGSTWQITPLNGSLDPAQYYLVQEAQGAGGTVNLPTPNATGSIAMSATAGKVALVNTAAALAGTCPAGASIIDFIGYGSGANCFEGAGAAPTLTNTTADLRAGAGTVDTDNNNADFAAGAPNPRNSTPPPPPPVITAIHDIQGSGSESPFAGQSVSTQGIVTARKSNGFFVELPAAEMDANPNTSEGIFVFTSSAPPAEAAVGNSVRISGTVSEFKGDPNSPPLTEITNPVVTVLSAGNTLPPPVSITAADTPATGTPEQLERLEGMRVHVDSLTTISPTLGNVNEPNATGSSSGVFYAVITGIARPFREPGIDLLDPLPAGSPCCVTRFDTNPERLRVDSDAQDGAALLELTSGVLVINVTGVLDYGFRTYTIDPDPAPTPTVTPNITATPVPAPATGQLTVGSFNMQRFYDTIDEPLIGDIVLTASAFNNRLNKASLAIRNMMRTPDVIGVEEMENLATLQAVASKVNNDAVVNGDSNPNYQAYLFEGNDPGGIDVGFLVKTSRIQVISVTQQGKDTTYTNPITQNQDLLNDRPPLVLKAKVRSMTFTVIVNHLRSFLDIDDAIQGPRVRAKRRAQAEFLANYIQNIQSNNAGEKVISVGDYNSFQFSDGYVDLMGTIKGLPTRAIDVVLASDDLVNPDLINLIDTVPSDDRYSYSFDGNAQAIDHILITPNLSPQLVRLAFARNNADFPETYRSDATRSERVSDHDMPVAYFTIPNAQPDAVDDTFNTSQDAPVSGSVLGNDSDADGDPVKVTSATAPSNGTLDINSAGTFTYTPNANFFGSDAFTYTVSDGQGGSDTATVSIHVHPRYTLTVTTEGMGTITGNGIDCGGDCTETYATFPKVQTVTLTASPSAGSHFVRWTGDCAGTGTCTITMMAHHSAKATFAKLSTTGKMTGSGKVNSLQAQIDMDCNPGNKKSKLQVDGDKDNKFALKSITSVACYDDPSISPKQKHVNFDTIVGTGSGEFNKTPATIEWKFSDAGEPSVNDSMTITIRAGNTVVLNYSGPAGNGNIQAHK